MNKTDEIIAALNRDGFRITKARRSILDVLAKEASPLSAEEILLRLGSFGAAANKTTVYREILFLKERGIVSEVQFIHERLKRFELVRDAHHHHLVCVRCRRVDEIVLENELAEEEERIYRTKGFKVLGHTLEFTGVCTECL